MTRRNRDETDRKLIALLQTDARMPLSALARKLGVARSTARDRLVRLEREGVIAGYTVILGGDHKPQTAKALVLLSVTQQQSRRVVAELETFPQIRLCLAVSGEFDLFLSVVTDRLDELDSLLDTIAEIPGVERSRSVIVLSRKFDREAAEAGFGAGRI